MAQCSRCIGGYWKGLSAYPCFSCNGTGIKRERQSRARRKAAAESTGLLLQIDVMPTLAEAQASRSTLAERGGECVRRMGPGAQRLRALAMARVRILAPTPTPVALGRGAFHDDSVVQRAAVGGRVREYDEVFGGGSGYDTMGHNYADRHYAAVEHVECHS